MIVVLPFTFPYWTGRLRAMLDKMPPWSFYRLLQGGSWLMSFSSMMVAGMQAAEALRKMMPVANPYLRERLRAGFVEPVMDMEHLTLTYTDVQTLMHDLKNIGAHNVTAGRAHGLTGRGRLLRMQSAYEKQRRDGRLPASYEVIYGTAWTPAYIPAAMLTPGEARAAIRKRRGDGDRN